MILYFKFAYFGKFTIFKLVIKKAQNPSIIHSNFQQDLSLYRNLISSISKSDNVSVSLVFEDSRVELHLR